jgi:endonuclease/exonuclease/phosphatase (EEP) superfamily protein YafD
VLCVSALALAVVAALSYFGKYDWRIDLFSHLRWHYALMACILLPILLIRRRIRFAALLAAYIIWNANILLYPVASLAAMPGWSTVQPGRHLRLANFNVLCSNASYDPTVNWLRKVEPDLAVLTEFTSPLQEAMESLATLPHHTGSPDPEGNGIAIYSRYKILRSETLYLGQAHRMLLTAVIDVDGREVTLFAVHPFPPTSQFAAHERDAYLSELGRTVRRTQGPVIVAGDMNATPWSHAFQELLSASLTLPHFTPTWQAGWGRLGIPIDHVLGRGVRITELRAGPLLGSDHLPVLAEIVIADPPGR